MIIKGLDFRQTCAACPEQYDVFDENGHQVGYARLRWGGLRCDYPDCGGENIYRADIGVGSDCVGCFQDGYERKLYLTIIANRILKRIKRDEDENNRKEAIRLVMKGLDDGYLDLEAACSQIDRDELAVIKEAMELLIERENK